MVDRASRGVRTPVVTTLLILNLVVFGLWTTATPSLSFLVDHFLISWLHLAEGRLWTTLTSAFSHNMLFHLLINVIVLLNFGPPMELVLGRARFLAFYLVAGAVASLSHAAVSAFLLGRPEQPALGASGAIAGVLLLYAFTFPRARVLLFFFVPMPAILAALAFIAIDVWGLMAQLENGGLPIGHGAHLGGALTGMLYFALARPSPPRWPEARHDPSPSDRDEPHP
jgi:rhomboid-like protein